MSYVWRDTGETDYRTMIENIQSRQKSGGLGVTIWRLPKAIFQSIRLVNDLGIRYVWIGALCIVQDTSHSKRTQNDLDSLPNRFLSHLYYAIELLSK